MKIKILLVNGERFIGQEVPKSKAYTNCLKMIEARQEDGGIQVGFSAIMHPYSTSRKGIDVEKSHVVASCDCPIGLIESYIEVISMGDPE